MHLLILPLIKICDHQSNFCIAYICSFRNKWHGLQRKMQTQILASKFIESTSNNATRTAVQASKFYQNKKYAMANSLGLRLRTNSHLVGNSVLPVTQKIKLILAQAFASLLGPPKGTTDVKVDKEHNSAWKKNYFGVQFNNLKDFKLASWILETIYLVFVKENSTYRIYLKENECTWLVRYPHQLMRSWRWTNMVNCSLFQDFWVISGQNKKEITKPAKLKTQGWGMKKKKIFHYLFAYYFLPLKQNPKPFWEDYVYLVDSI